MGSLSAFSSAAWARFSAGAREAGLNALWVLSRESLQQTGDPASVLAGWHPGYRTVVVVGDGGPRFFERFRAAVPDPAAHAEPLDGYTEQVVEALAAVLRDCDHALVTAYPFRHARQLLGFQQVLAPTGLTTVRPFGLTVEPTYGPWMAWRAAIVTALPLPSTPPLAEHPCTGCPAPCASACPAGAVSPAGFDWPGCADHRLRDPGCHERCDARLACPVGAAHRYGEAQLRFHYCAGLREIRRLRQA